MLTFTPFLIWWVYFWHLTTEILDAFAAMVQELKLLGFFGWGAQLLTTSGENAEQDIICVGVTTCVAMDEVESNTGLDLN